MPNNNLSYNTSFRANGKLLLTAEYLVMHGAKALVLPVQLGQTLEVLPINNQLFQWHAYSEGACWLDITFDEELKILQTNDFQLAQRLASILLEALQLGGLSTSWLMGKQVICHLEFNRFWGLGSSSTLVALLGQWLRINPYHLLELTFKGSGYDVAAAHQHKPFIYSKDKLYVPKIETFGFNPNFKEGLLFFYLGKKKVSGVDVKKFLQQPPNQKDIDEVNCLTKEIVQCANLNTFQLLLKEHEDLIASYTKQVSINQEITFDSGVAKSLGAWGGDFALLATEDIAKARGELLHKGFDVVFTYNQLILH